MLTLLIISFASSVFRSSFSCVLSFLFSLKRVELGWGVCGNVCVGVFRAGKGLKWDDGWITGEQPKKNEKGKWQKK
jgi:hypothetical protein